MMLSSRPLVCIALAFVVGIGLAAYSVPCVGVVLGMTVLLAACFAITRRTLWGTLLFACTFVLFGAGRYLITTLVATTDVSHSAPAYVTLIGTVDSEVRVTPNARPGYPANGQFTLNTRGIVLQNDIQNDVQNAAQDDSGGSTQENGRRNVQEQSRQTSANEAGGLGTRVIAVSGQVQARIPLAPVLPMRMDLQAAIVSKAGKGQFDFLHFPTGLRKEKYRRLLNRICRIMATRCCCAGDWNALFPPVIRVISIMPRTCVGAAFMPPLPPGGMRTGSASRIRKRCQNCKTRC